MKLYLRFTTLNTIMINSDSRALIRSDDAILKVVDFLSAHTLLLFGNQAVRVDYHTDRDVCLISSLRQSSRVFRHLTTILKRVFQNVDRKRREATLGCRK